MSSSPRIQQAYEQMRIGGESHYAAEICAFRRTAALRTDTEFLAGQNANYRTISQLEEYPGDPRARVSGRADIRRICEERGWGCRGAVDVEAREREPIERPYKVAPDLVERKAAELASLHGVDVRETRAAAEKALSPSGGVCA